MNRQHCKQHECGLCNQDHHFCWGKTGGEHLGGADDTHDADHWDGTVSFNTLRPGPYMESELRVFERQAPEYQLCQT